MSETLRKVLIVDDDMAVTNYFMVFLMQTELFEPEVENDSRQVMGRLQDEEYDVIMLDLDMPNVTGMEILTRMRAEDIHIPVVILTGASDVDLAVRAMKHGAFDYLTKPVDDEHLLEVLSSAVEMGVMQASMEKLTEKVATGELQHQAAFAHLPTENPEMLKLFHEAETLAGGNLNLFIHGERGCGKKWLAKAIHQASGRADKPFLALDCTSQAPDELSGVLFGRAQDWQGATKEVEGILTRAQGGTVFMNNIEHMSPPVQVRLNHAIQTGEYYSDNSTAILNCDTRFIMASTHDLTSSRFQDSFSRDLLYHVTTTSLHMPALRERPCDIPVLAHHFLAEESRRNNKKISGISDEFLALLQDYFFPGNVQELRKLIISAVALTRDDLLDVDDISAYSRERLTLGAFTHRFQPRTLADVVRTHVRDTVRYCSGDRREAALLLQINEEELAAHADLKGEEKED